MRVAIATILIILSVVVTPIVTRPPTKCDIDNINSKIRIMKNKVRDLQNYIKWIGDEQKRNEYDLKRIGSDIEKHTSYSIKKITDSQKWLVSRVTKHIKWFDQIRYKGISSEIDKQFKNYSEHTWKAVSSLRSNDSNWRGTFIKNPLVQIMRSYPKQSKRLVVETGQFLKKVKSLGSKTFGEMDKVKNDLYLVSRQVQLQQFNEYEKARSDGNTGIKQIRTSHVGAKNYHSNDHNGWSIAGITDIKSSERYIGISDFVAVLNGIEFRTSQNKYKLEKPVTNDITFHKTEPIVFPDVPTEVKQMTDHKAQMEEMRKWFKAFKNQDESTRDFTKYFKPVLSYLEGAWVTDTENDQQSEKFSYTSFTGFKGFLPYLPTTIMGFNGHDPMYSTWNYRILCHPLENYLSTKRFKQLFDPVTQRRHNWKNTKDTPAAKFDIEGLDVNGNRRKVGAERPQYYTFLDALMEEVPGKDNYGASITANGFDAEIRSAHPKRNGQKLNGAHYHRPYKLASKDAMGVDTAARGYADRLYIALTKNQRISGPTFNESGKSINIKASYAMPMEIIYITPLSKWNPYNIQFKQDCSKVSGDGLKTTPFDSYCPDLNFHTPEAFFTNGDPTVCSKNDASDAFYFISPDTAKPICMVASGLRIFLPDILGNNGPTRLRYPIMPVNGEGASIWKKLNAIEDSINLSGEIVPTTLSYETGESTVTYVPIHKHIIVITKAEEEALLSGKVKFIKKATEPNKYHRHIFTLKRKNGTKNIGISACDSGNGSNGMFCFDAHKNVLVLVK